MGKKKPHVPDVNSILEREKERKRKQEEYDNRREAVNMENKGLLQERTRKNRFNVRTDFQMTLNRGAGVSIRGRS